MPINQSPPTNKSSVHKGAVYLVGAISFIVLWGVGYGANMWVYTTLNVLPILLSIITSIAVAWFIDRIVKVYPGSGKIFGYVVGSFTAIFLGVIALNTLSNGQSWLDIGIATAVIALVYPVVAIGFSRALEVFTHTLGINAGGVSQLEHYDTLHPSKDEKEESPLQEAFDDFVESDASGLELPPRDFSKAISTVSNSKGVDIISIDLDELAKAQRPERANPDTTATEPIPVIAEENVATKPIPVKKPVTKRPAAKKPSVTKAPAKAPVKTTTTKTPVAKTASAKTPASGAKKPTNPRKPAVKKTVVKDVETE